MALGGFPEAARTNAFIEGVFDAIHVVEGLRFEGGGNRDDTPAFIRIAKEEPGK